jgi:hypothetical protein
VTLALPDSVAVLLRQVDPYCQPHTYKKKHIQSVFKPIEKEGEKEREKEMEGGREEGRREERRDGGTDGESERWRE